MNQHKSMIDPPVRAWYTKVPFNPEENVKTHLLNLFLLPLLIACTDPNAPEDPREVEILNLSGNHQMVQAVQVPLNTDESVGADFCAPTWEIGDELQLEVAEVPNGEGTTVISWDTIMEDQDETICEAIDEDSGDCIETAPCFVLKFGTNGGFGYSTGSIYWLDGLTCALGLEGDTVCGT